MVYLFHLSHYTSPLQSESYLAIVSHHFSPLDNGLRGR
jgi:hypothetical protein